MRGQQFILWFGFFCSLLGLAWKGLNWFYALADKANKPAEPSVWKFRNRLMGWSVVLGMLILAGMEWIRFLIDNSAFWKWADFVLFICWLWISVAWAFVQNRIWATQGRLGRLDKVGFLEDLFDP